MSHAPRASRNPRLALLAAALATASPLFALASSGCSRSSKGAASGSGGSGGGGAPGGGPGGAAGVDAPADGPGGAAGGGGAPPDGPGGTAGGGGAPASGPGGAAGGGGAPGGGPGGAAGVGGSPASGSGDSSPITVAPSAAEQSERARVAAALAPVQALDSAGLLARYPSGTSVAASLGYDPLTAANLDLIAGSTVGLSAPEQQVLGKNGFVVSDRLRFPGFTYGYASIYAADLPLFISADSILYAVHRSYDAILKALETASLRPTLAALLQGMRANLAANALAGLGPDVAPDIDLYLAVPLGLLTGTAPAPVAGASPAAIADLLAKASAASGTADITLFGVLREDEDFSQYTPRGHYTDSPELTTYFKAMTWLGRFDERMVETLDDGSQVFHRRQFDGALGLTQLLASGDNTALWRTLDTALGAFVGEPDSMQPTEFPALLAKLGAADLAAVKALDDATIAAALVAGNFGGQRISSHIMIVGVHDQAFPLSRSFLLLGQRYVVDSHVFSNVVYDRVPPTKATPSRLRMLPDPLDVAFAVFANNQAASILTPQLDTFAYAPALAAMRVLVDDHGDAFWSENLYNQWLSALRALTPVAGGQSGPLSVTATDAWGRRLLQTQLASWAELRHDTILYVKQSYSIGIACAFPDALVEPNPAFWGKLVDLAAKGQAVAAGLPDTSNTSLPATAATYFAQLGTVAATLKGMAEDQASGTPFSAEQMAFINQSVRIQPGCGSPSGASGWYPKLFFSYPDSFDFHPTIADVHTAPTDESGNPVGNVLHVGTGYARLMVVTANTCEGPKAYAGLTSSYYEQVTENLQRLDDITWQQSVTKTPPADVPWMQDLITH